MLCEYKLLGNQKANERIGRGCCFALVCFLETLVFLGQCPKFFKTDSTFCESFGFFLAWF